LDLAAAVLPVHVTSVPDPKNPHALPRVINFIDDSCLDTRDNTVKESGGKGSEVALGGPLDQDLIHLPIPSLR
jgi:hypothetical protein